VDKFPFHVFNETFKKDKHDFSRKKKKERKKERKKEQIST